MKFGWRLSILLLVLAIVYCWKSSQLIIAPKRFIYPYKPSDFGMEYRSVNFTTQDGIKLDGWFIPASNPKATLIICHGYGTDKGDGIYLAKVLQPAGYNALLFDFRGHGQSEGKYCSLGYYEREDLKTAIKWLLEHGEKYTLPAPLRQAKRDGVGRQVGAIGFSMGGTVALLVQTEVPELVAVVSDGAYVSFHSAITSFARKYFKAPKYPFIPPAAWAAGLRLRFNPKELDLREFLPQASPKPVFIIHGTADREILPTDAKAIFEVAPGPKELWLVPGAHHIDTWVTAGKEYKQRIIAFFDVVFK